LKNEIICLIIILDDNIFIDSLDKIW
jgi:hypothetical protein